MIKIDTNLLNQEYSKSQNSERKRVIYRFHSTDDDLLQRMLNTAQPQTYFPPHKHENPDKREVFLLLSGRCALIEYNDSGEIIDYIILDYQEGNIGVEIPARVWHQPIILKENTCIYEFKDGPYRVTDDKVYASWAPLEGDKDAKTYDYAILALLEKLNTGTAL